MFGAAHGGFVLLFSLSLAGLLPHWLGLIVMSAVGLLVLAWVLMLFVLPMLQGFFDLLR